jgi:hypothetical protein
MTRHVRTAVLASITLASSLPVPLMVAEKAKPVPPAPIPSQIISAKRIFIANAGEDNGSTSQPAFNGDIDRTYNQFYAAMKTWGHYQLADSPADADLLFEIELDTPQAGREAANNDTLCRSYYDPHFHLVIRDAKNNALLWAFTEHVQNACLQSNLDKNFDQAMERIVAGVQRICSSVAPVTDASKP